MGRGAFGRVVAGEGAAPEHEQNVLLAVKFLSSQPAKEYDHSFLAEFDHPNVVKYFGVGMDNTTIDCGSFIVAEFCKGTSPHYPKRISLSAQYLIV